AKRQVRRMRLAMAASIGSLALIAGVLGHSRRDLLASRHAQLQKEASARSEAQAELDRLKAQLERERANEELLRRAQPGHSMAAMFELIAKATPGRLLLESVVMEDNAPAPDPADKGRAATAATEGPRSLRLKLTGLAENELSVR